jgi:hypothetical protein
MTSSELTEWMAFDHYEYDRMQRELKQKSAARERRLGPATADLEDDD